MGSQVVDCAAGAGEPRPQARCCNNEPLSSRSRIPIVRTSQVLEPLPDLAGDTAGSAHAGALASPRTDADGAVGALMQSLRSGDTNALAQIYDRYGRAVHAVAFRVTADEGFAQDVTQEVFLALWRNPDGYRADRGSLGSFLVGSAHHKAVDIVRREESVRRRRDRATVEFEHDLKQEVNQLPVDDMAWQSWRADRVKVALAELSAPQREAVLLAYYRGHTQREIAALTGVPLGTVKTRTLAAFRRLRELLGDALDDAALDSAFGPGNESKTTGSKTTGSKTTGEFA
jgi:RNA polymerase sigma factor (sigma-70 family)